MAGEIGLSTAASALVLAAALPRTPLSSGQWRLQACTIYRSACAKPPAAVCRSWCPPPPPLPAAAAGCHCRCQVCPHAPCRLAASWSAAMKAGSDVEEGCGISVSAGSRSPANPGGAGNVGSRAAAEAGLQDAAAAAAPISTAGSAHYWEDEVFKGQEPGKAIRWEQKQSLRHGLPCTGRMAGPGCNGCSLPSAS